MKKTNCMIMRAGTSKGIFFREEDMPQDREKWSEFLLDIMGSPDKRQIDGLGGANSLTSKVAIVGKSDEEGIDVNYTFAQVSITDKVVDFKGNCGNVSSGVGSFAIESKLIKGISPITKVMIKNTNTNKLIQSDVQVEEGFVVENGNCEIPGVPGTGAKIDLTFYKPQGAVTGKLLPSGKATETIMTSIGEIEISILDSANPLVFMKAEDLGLTGTELHYEFTQEKLDLVEEIRSIACEICGFASKEEATKKSPAVPKATIISTPKNYKDMSDRETKSEDMDLLIRMMSMQKPHQALAITGAVCTATAFREEDTLVNRLVNLNSNLNLNLNSKEELLLGHPGGIMKVKIKGEESVEGVTVERTARVIMEGKVRTKKEY